MTWPQDGKFSRVSPTTLNPDALIENRPTAPSLWFQIDHKLMALPILDLQANITIYVTTASCKLKIVFQNTYTTKLDLLFLLPLKGTVTQANVKIGDKRYVETAVVSNEDLKKLPQQKPSSSTIPTNQPYDTYIPDLFRLPVLNVNRDDLVFVEVDYLESLEFVNGRYNFNLSLNIAPSLLPTDRTLAEIVRLNGVIHTVTTETTVYSERHALRLTRDPSNPRIDIVALHQSTDCVDFNLSYALITTTLIPTLIKEVTHMDSSKGEEQGNFALFVTPPSLDSLSTFFPRNIVFILDRSGSMTGRPWEQAVRGLEVALKNLRPIDAFGVVLFDHTIRHWNQFLVLATPENIHASMTWARFNAPDGGLTEIHGPLEWAFQLLHDGKIGVRPSSPLTGDKGEKAFSSQPTLTTMESSPLISPPESNPYITPSTSETRPTALPFVFLLTDGCVEEERKICTFARSKAGAVRILTFGVGSQCNWYFLKMLAEIGRGFSDACVYQEQIYPKVVALLTMAAVPVLTSIHLVMPSESTAVIGYGRPSISTTEPTDEKKSETRMISSTLVTSCELYPFPIPDLFVGAPLIVAGQYTAKGRFPDSVRLQGYLADGGMLPIDVPTCVNAEVPVSKVFLKQQLDILTARAWLEDSEELKKKVIELSCMHSMPSAHTTMVAYETTESKKKDDKKHDDKKKTASSHNMAKVAALAVGGAIVLSTAAVVFGSLTGTLNNVPVGDVLSSIGSVADVGSCCQCCGCFGDCFSGIGSCFGGCFSWIGDCCSSIWGCFGGCCGDIGHFCCEIPSCLGSVFGSCGECFCGIFGALGDCFSSCGGDCCSMFDCLCQVLSLFK